MGIQLSKHGKRRLKTRGNTTGGKDKLFLQRVVRYGLTSEYLDDGPLRDFVVSRERAVTFRAVLLYAQHVYVFDKTMTTLVTVMHLPPEVLALGDRVSAANRWRVDTLANLARVDGHLRGLKRPLTEQEVTRLNDLSAVAGKLAPSKEFFREWTKTEGHSDYYWGVLDDLWEVLTVRTQ